MQRGPIGQADSDVLQIPVFTALRSPASSLVCSVIGFPFEMLLITRTNVGRIVQPLQPNAIQRALLQRLSLSTPAQLLSRRLPRPPN